MKTATERSRQFRLKIKNSIIATLGGKCSRCGYDKCSAALCCHHVDPSKKEFGLHSGSAKKWSLTKKEIEKCILLCANCHAEIHYLQDQEQLRGRE